MLVALLLPASASAGGWEDAPPLTAPPAELLAAAADGAPTDAPVETILEDAKWVYDAEGRLTRSMRQVYRVYNPQAAQDWASVSVAWADWHEERPRLEARVITPDGAVHTLDPALVGEAVDPAFQADVYRDVRVLRAPLPNVVAGAVVEVVQEVREHRPFFAGGGVQRWTFGNLVPVRRTRVVVEVPEKARLSWRMHNGELQPQVEKGGGVRRYTWAQGAMAPLERPEPFLPNGVFAYPTLEFSTAKDWRSLAAAYAAIAEERLVGVDLSAEVARVRQTVPAGDKEALIASLYAEAQRLRYTSIAFGESAIVPANPRDTLSRGFGDCKDKALLLVGLLRAAGFPADIALLRAGGGPDASEDMPGLDLFNHAIVRVGGPVERWLDPTSPFAALGDLPPSDQGRMALVASPTTKGLVKIPRLPSAVSTVSVLRELDLAAIGPASGQETSTSTGWLAQAWREGWSHGRTGDAVKAYFADMASTDWSGEVDGEPTISDPADLRTPLSVSWRARNASTGWTSEVDALVDLRPSAVLGFIPDVLTTPTDTPRKNDLEILPFRGEIEYRVRPPDGFVARELPADERFEVAGFVWDVRFATLPDGRISARFVVDTGPGRWTPAQLAELSEALQTLYARNRLSIRFAHPGALALEEGRVSDAITAYRQLADAHPKDGFRRAQWALALGATAQGEQARREAAAAAALAPNDPEVLGLCGRVWMHDRFGRFLTGDFDRKEAERLLRRSVELGPDAADTRANLAFLLARGPDGRVGTAGSDLAAAISILQERRSKLEEKDLDTVLMAWLARAERWDEVQALAREQPVADGRAWLVLVAAIKGGADAGVAEVNRLGGDAEARRTALESAGRELINLRQYAAAASLLERAAVGSQNPVGIREQARTIAKLRRHETLEIDSSTPSGVFQALTRDTLLGGDIARWLSTAALEVEDLEAARRGALEGKEGDTSPDLLLDFTLSAMELQVDGDAKSGWRVRSIGREGGSLGMFVIKERGALKVRANSTQLAELGLEALGRLDRGDVAGARTWLGWAEEAVGDNAVATPFRTLWRTAKDSEDRALLGVAAAVLTAGDEKRAEIGLPRLEAATPAGDEQRTAAGFARILALTTLHRWEDVAAYAEQFGKEHPTVADAAFGTRGWALISAGRPKDARALAQQWLGSHPDDEDGLRILSSAALAEGDLPAGRDALVRLEAIGKASAADLNNLAWYTDGDPASLEAALKRALASSTRRNHKSDSALHTLAVILLDLGRTTEAHEVMRAALALGEGDEPLGEHWSLVRGRLAEAWGLPDAAKEIYGTVPVPGPADDAWSTRSRVAERVRMLAAR